MSLKRKESTGKGHAGEGEEGECREGIHRRGRVRESEVSGVASSTVSLAGTYTSALITARL